ncbi:MAG: hypothetical protein WCI51_03075 [Lentisphaerota bacterium]
MLDKLSRVSEKPAAAVLDNAKYQRCDMARKHAEKLGNENSSLLEFPELLQSRYINRLKYRKFQNSFLARSMDFAVKNRGASGSSSLYS